MTDKCRRTQGLLIPGKKKLKAMSHLGHKPYLQPTKQILKQLQLGFFIQSLLCELKLSIKTASTKRYRYVQEELSGSKAQCQLHALLPVLLWEQSEFLQSQAGLCEPHHEKGVLSTTTKLCIQPVRASIESSKKCANIRPISTATASTETRMWMQACL